MSTDPAAPGASPADGAAPPSTAAVVLAGATALAVAMGIGRFAFTPLMPLMMRDGLIDATGGAELAAANYLGYLVGALGAARLAGRPLRLVLASLAAIVAVTMAAAAVDSLAAWAVLRGAAGVASACAMVGVSTWTLGELARRGRGVLGAGVFAGVGGGIALAGTLAWLAAAAGARALWLLMGLVALPLAAAVAWLARGALCVEQAPPATPPPAARAAPPAGLHGEAGSVPAGSWPLVLCYGVTGFGYILPATFLPAMARSLIDDPQRFGLAWPLFGLAAMASMLVAVRGLASWPPLRTWAVCQAAIGLGTGLPLLSRSGAAIALAALLVGSTFVLATVIGLQQARALVPRHPAPLLGRMTAAFALGQIAGPLLVRALAGVQWGPWAAVELSSACATLFMLGTAAWLWQRGRPPATSAASMP